MMRGYLARRLLSSLPTLLGITLVTFLLLEILPGREMVLAGRREGVLPTSAELSRIRTQFHFDEPVWRRYLQWLLLLCRRDLGRSLLDGRSVGRILAESAIPTLTLNLAALLLSFGVSIPLGVTW